MLNKLIFSTLGFCTLMNCQTQKIIDSENNSAKNEVATSTKIDNSQNLIYLNEGENIFLKEYQMNVTFKGIISDSRCPTGVNCIWSGAATASVEIMTTTSRPMLIELSTVNLDGKNLVKTQDIFGYTITLEQVLPYPNQKDKKEDLKGHYQIALKIEKQKPATNE
ncbi:hypothetical protein SAMN05421847_0100 [Halpernia humi]|uniref:Uncharacterized protein n=1 Tax=Halpernia humi TaxID=493375 RepID=A0A1H5SDL9_9FLAO|nr:hypothetical protein [Halpernia humi]SEF48068.1 hypothetical protein SAMN05421847_0100 [Halpernia humi]